MNTKTRRLRKTLVVLVAIALILAPNLITFADEAEGAQGTPTPVATVEAAAQQATPTPPDGAEKEEASEEVTPAPTPFDEEGDGQPAPAPESEEASEEVTPAPTPFDEEGDDQPAPAPESEEASEEVTPAPTPSDDSEATPTPTPSGEMLPAAAPLGADVTGEPKAFGPEASRTLTFSKTGNGYFHVSVYYNSHGTWYFWYSSDIGSGSYGFYGNSKIKVEAIGSNGDTFQSWSSKPSASTGTNPIEFEMNNHNQSVGAVFDNPFTPVKFKVKDVDGDDHYKVTYTNSSGTLVTNEQWSPGQEKDVLKNTTVTVMAIPDATHDFKEWDKPNLSEGVNPAVINIGTSDYEAEADFDPVPTKRLRLYGDEGLERLEYSIAFRGSTMAGQTSPPDNGYSDISVPIGASVTVNAVSENSAVYVFEKWGGHTSSSYMHNTTNPLSFTMTDGNMDLEPKFREIVMYTLSFDGTRCTYTVDGDPTHYIGGQSKQIEEGTSVSVTAHPESGYKCVGWDYTPSNDKVSNPTVFTMNGNCAVNSNMQIATYDISFVNSTGLDHYSYTVNGGSSININGGQSATFDPDDVVVVTAHEKALYSFSSWDGSTNANSTSGADATFTMNADKTAKALFNDIGYYLDLKMTGNLASYTVAAGSETFTVTSDTNMHLAQGTSVSVTANPISSKVFDYWEGNAPLGSRNGNLWSFTMEDDYWVKAYCDTLSNEKFKVTHENFAGDSGSGQVQVFYNGTSRGTLSAGQSVDITYVNGVNQVTVVAIPDPSCQFVIWANHGVTTPTMIIDLITGQGSAPAGAMSIECHVTVEVKVKPKFERLGSLEVTKVDELNPALKLADARFTLTGPGYSEERITGPSGIASWTGLHAGTYTLTETQAPDGYEMKPDHTWTVKVGPGGGITTECAIPEAWDLELTVKNKPVHCSLTVNKKDSSGNLIDEAVFELFDSSNNSMGQKTTSGGTAKWEDLDAGEYTLKEISAPDGYYWETETHNVTLTPNTQGWPEFETSVTNLKYVKIYAQKKDIDTGELLSGAQFAIFNTDGNGSATTQIGAAQLTDGSGIAEFGYAYGLKHGVTYWIKEVGAPTGYNNDSDTAIGYAVTVGTEGGSNEQSPVLFENSIMLQKITVVKSFMEVLVSNIGGGFLDGVEFELYEGTNPGPSDTPIDTQVLSNGTCVFNNLRPGTYTIKEVDGPITKYIEVAADEEVTLELAEADGQNTDVGFNNYIDEGAFRFVKHDSLTEEPLAGATYRLTGMAWNGSAFVLTSYEMTTGSDGSAQVTGLTPGMYTFQEIRPAGGHDIDTEVYNVEILPGRTTEEVAHYFDDPLGKITIAKKVAGTDARIFGATFQLYRDSVAPENAVGGVVTTDPNGNAWWTGLPAGTYVIYEVSAPSGYAITTRSTFVELEVGESKVVTIYNDSTTTTAPPIILTPEPPPFGPEATPTPTPTPVPTATPTPIASDELTIEDVDPAFGPETGEGDGLFMTIGILLLMAAALFVIRKRTVIRTR